MKKNDKQDESKERKNRAIIDSDTLFPLNPIEEGFSPGYSALLTQLKQRIHQERIQTILATNTKLILLYWDIGKSILEKQKKDGWGAGVIDRLAADLQIAFPDMKGFSSRNLKYMRAFYSAWPNISIVQRSVAQLPWRHNIVLLEKLGEIEERLWYANKTMQNGWSRDILAMQIETNAIKRFGKSQNNFHTTLPPEDSDMASQIFKDPYLFDFLGTDEPRREHELEQGLIDHVQKFLLELGQGFAFVGRQVHLELGGEDFYLDLLFYHLTLRRYIVIELKARKFEVKDGAQLGLYMTAVDKLIAHAEDKQTLGLLLVREKNKILVEYALCGSTNPISVSEWEIKLTKALPEEFRGRLPTIDELESELTTENIDLLSHEKKIHQLKSVKNSNHFEWGDNCHGWWLKNDSSFTVASEIMSPSTHEKKHLHKNTTQFFYCLKGNLTIEMLNKTYHLTSGDSLIVEKEIAHAVHNKSKSDIEFLVVSTLNPHNDRIYLE